MLRLMKLKLICIYIEHKAWPKWVVPPLATCPCWKVVLQLRQAVGTCWWSPRCLKHPQNSTGGFSLSWRWKPWGFLWNQDATLLLVPLSRWTASLAMEDRAPKEYAFLYCHVWGLSDYPLPIFSTTGVTISTVSKTAWTKGLTRHIPFNNEPKCCQACFSSLAIFIW